VSVLVTSSAVLPAGEETEQIVSGLLAPRTVARHARSAPGAGLLWQALLVLRWDGGGTRRPESGHGW